MNRFFTLISAISGIVAGLLSIYVVPPVVEIGLWLMLVAALGAVVQRYSSHKLFLRGFLYGAISGMFITIIDVLLISDYVTTHTREAMAMEDMGLGSDRMVLLVLAPAYWLMLGFFTGLSSIIWRKLRAD